MTTVCLSSITNLMTVSRFFCSLETATFYPMMVQVAARTVRREARHKLSTLLSFAVSV